MTDRITVYPRVPEMWVLLTATQPISHHDPAKTDKSNTNLHNRAVKLRPRMFRRETSEATGNREPVPLAVRERFCAGVPVPASVRDLVAVLDFAQFVAVSLVALVCELYARGDGVGLFAGVERYERLRTRLHAAAMRTGDLRRFWDVLCHDLALPAPPVARAADLARFWSLPLFAQETVVAVFRAPGGEQSVVSIAQLWNADRKAASKTGGTVATVSPDDDEPPAWIAGDDLQPIDPAVLQPDAPSAAVERIETYEHTANSLRHSLVRDPAWRHFAHAVGLGQGTRPGTGELSSAMESLFVNGGNMTQSAPSGAFAFTTAIRRMYPTLDLLGGSCDGFLLGTSRLQVGAWVVCAENAQALAETRVVNDPDASALLSLSALDMGDMVQHVAMRQETGGSPAPFAFETLAQGAMIAVKLTLLPGTDPLTAGALIAAVETFTESNPRIGGQGARGYGQVAVNVVKPLLMPIDDGEFYAPDDLRDFYEAYIEANAKTLKAGMIDGTLGTGAKVVGTEKQKPEKAGKTFAVAVPAPESVVA